jgi:hypothetical protein
VVLGRPLRHHALSQRGVDRAVLRDVVKVLVELAGKRSDGPLSAKVDAVDGATRMGWPSKRRRSA